MNYFYENMKLCNDNIVSYIINVRAPEFAPNSSHGGACEKTSRVTSGLKSDKVHMVKLVLFF